MVQAGRAGAARVVEAARDYRARRLVLRGRTRAGLTLLSVAALTAIQEPIGWGWLGWVALAPWVVATVTAARGGRGAWLNFAAGLAYYLGNLYWLSWVTPAGYAALVFYLAWYFVLTGWVLRRLYIHRRWPMTLVLPVIWVAQEFLRAWVFTGFPWLFLAHSQAGNLRLMQMSDALGAYGVTFLVAMVNGLACDLLLRPVVRGAGAALVRLDAATLALLTGCGVGGAVVYGQWRLQQGRELAREGPVVSVVQEAIPQDVKDSGQSDREIFARHLELSEAAWAGTVRPGLIVWPETMTCSPLNEEFLNVQARLRLEGTGWTEALAGFGLLQQSRSFDEQLRALASKGVAVLVGTPSVEMAAVGDELRAARKWNSAILYRRGGERSAGRYDKMHLVPFGEVVPFRSSWPWLYRQLNRLTPYDYEYTLDAGRAATVFEYQDGAGDQWRFGVAICYEDVMPGVVRSAVVGAREGGGKRVDFLLNISNDGWFVRVDRRTGRIRPSTELRQHLAICRFRAVENRIPIARAVNTGVSAFIDSDGAVHGGGLCGNLAGDVAGRQGAAGYLTDRLRLDPRVSPYSRVRDLFGVTCMALSGGLLVAAIGAGRGRKAAARLTRAARGR